MSQISTILLISKHHLSILQECSIFLMMMRNTLLWNTFPGQHSPISIIQELLFCCSACLFNHVGLLPPCTPLLPSRTISLTPYSAFATRSLRKNTIYSLLCLLKTNSWWPQEKVANLISDLFLHSQILHLKLPTGAFMSQTELHKHRKPCFFWWHYTSPLAHWQLL